MDGSPESFVSINSAGQRPDYLRLIAFFAFAAMFSGERP